MIEHYPPYDLAFDSNLKYLKVLLWPLEPDKNVEWIDKVIELLKDSRILLFCGKGNDFTLEEWAEWCMVFFGVSDIVIMQQFDGSYIVGDFIDENIRDICVYNSIEDISHFIRSKIP